jgi:hypothetical protein
VRRLLLPLIACLLSLFACGQPSPDPSAERRTWRGPNDAVASEGITTYDRRELAQRVNFPTCITIGTTAFRYGGTHPVEGGNPAPAGFVDTGYSLDRWRLLSPAGALEQQPVVYVTVLGSTGILSEYLRLPAGRGC